MRLRLHHRIVVPFAAIAAVALSSVAWWAYRVTSTTLSGHLRSDVANAAVMLSRNGLAGNVSIITAVKQVTGSDVVTFTERDVVATTLSGPGSEPLVARVRAAAGVLPPSGSVAIRELPGQPLVFVAYGRAVAPEGVVVALVHENTEVDRANSMLLRAVLTAAGVSLLVMLLISQAVARRVTRPIEQLSGFAAAVHTAQEPGRAPESEDEVGRLGRAFNQMLERLDQTSAALLRSEKLSLAGLFATRVAHDVRNPLSSIKMQTQLLHDAQAKGTEGWEMTAAILEDIAQVEFVVKDLLDLARPDRLQREPASVNDVLERVVRQITPQCRHRQLAISVDLANGLPKLSLDIGRLTQALLNVANNATEAMRGGGTLVIRSGMGEAGRSVVIDVEDDGVGVDADTLERAFDPFVTTKPGGIGLGLVNARSTIEGHGGTIVLGRRQPSGTRVRMTLPVA